MVNSGNSNQFVDRRVVIEVFLLGKLLILLCPRFVCSQLTLKTLRVCNFSSRQLSKLTWQLPSIYVRIDNENGLSDLPRTTGTR